MGWEGFPLMLALILGWVIGFYSGMIAGVLIVPWKKNYLFFRVALLIRMPLSVRSLFLKELVKSVSGMLFLGGALAIGSWIRWCLSFPFFILISRIESMGISWYGSWILNIYLTLVHSTKLFFPIWRFASPGRVFGELGLLGELLSLFGLQHGVGFFLVITLWNVVIWWPADAVCVWLIWRL